MGVVPAQIGSRQLPQMTANISLSSISLSLHPCSSPITIDHQLRIKFILESKSASSINSFHLSMGRHHRRSTHRTHHGKANDSSNRRMGEFARNLVIDEEHQAYKEGRSMSKHDDIRGNHSPVTLTNQLSGGNDYVRRWLAKTDEEANQHRSEYREARQKTPSQYSLSRDHTLGRLLLTLCFRSLYRSRRSPDTC
jgi:hypothetical protein